MNFSNRCKREEKKMVGQILGITTLTLSFQSTPQAALTFATSTQAAAHPRAQSAWQDDRGQHFT